MENNCQAISAEFLEETIQEILDKKWKFRNSKLKRISQMFFRNTHLIIELVVKNLNFWLNKILLKIPTVRNGNFGRKIQSFSKSSIQLKFW